MKHNERTDEITDPDETATDGMYVCDDDDDDMVQTNQFRHAAGFD